MSAVGDEPARGGVIEDELLGRPRRRYSLAVSFDFFLNFVRYGSSERGRVAQNLH